MALNPQIFQTDTRPEKTLEPPLQNINIYSASIRKKFWGGHRPKNGPKRPHFRGKIRKMCRFCLILEILGGHVPPPPAPLLMEALVWI